MTIIVLVNYSERADNWRAVPAMALTCSTSAPKFCFLCDGDIAGNISHHCSRGQDALHTSASTVASTIHRTRTGRFVTVASVQR